MEARSFHQLKYARHWLFGSATLFLVCYFGAYPAEAQILRAGGPMRGMHARIMQPPVAHPQVVPQQFVAHGENFIVFASSPQWAQQVLEAAEKYRRELALYWLGKELPPWSQRCPVHVHAGAQLGASGETRFSPILGGVGDWMMSVNGTPERILDSVLPHEVSHTIFASHFAKYAQRGRFVPRWADEGACTTVEHESEKRKHRHYLHQFLKTGRGLAFNEMFRLKEYPHDILPLYAQGHSAVQFLIDQSDPQEFVRFLESGMQSGDWQGALRTHYGYETVGKFQNLWNKWLFDGSPASLVAYAPKLQRSASIQLASAEDFRNGQLKGKLRFAIGNTDPAPGQLAANSADHARSKAEEQSNSWYKNRLRKIHESNSAAARVTPPSQLVGSPILPSQTSGPKALPPEEANREMAGTKEAIAIRPPNSVPLQRVLASQRSFASHSSARQQPPQRTQVQSLQWGENGKSLRPNPEPARTSVVPQLVPIHR